MGEGERRQNGREIGRKEEGRRRKGEGEERKGEGEGRGRRVNETPPPATPYMERMLCGAKRIWSVRVEGMEGKVSLSI